MEFHDQRMKDRNLRMQRERGLDVIGEEYKMDDDNIDDENDQVLL